MPFHINSCFLSNNKDNSNGLWIHKLTYGSNIFIRPRSDHSLRMSVTNSLTNELVKPKYADYEDYEDYAEYAKYAENAKCAKFANKIYQTKPTKPNLPN